MQLIKYPLILFWRLWFYIIMFSLVILLSPLLLITTAHIKTYRYFYWIAHNWAKLILWVMGFKVEILNSSEIIPNKSYVFSANHTSMIDVFVMLAILPKNPFVFVGKVELARIPIFGFFYRRTMILVDRSDAKSRQAVYAQAQRKLKHGLSVCIFPEGLVPAENVVLAPFKNGAFSLASEHHIPIVPISFLDCKKHFSYTFFSGSPGTLRVNFHSPILPDINYDDNSIQELKSQVYQLIYKDITDETFLK